MKVLSLLSLLALSSAAAVVRRGAAQTTKDLQTFDTDLKNLYTACNSWNGQASTIGSINSAEKQTETDIKTANTNAASSAVFSSGDSKSIITYLSNTLEPDLNKALTCLSSKKAQLKSSNQLSAQLAELKTLGNLTSTLGGTLYSKCAADQKSSAQTVGTKINNDYNNAINTLSS